jgi:ArsR family transcriptional regulator
MASLSQSTNAVSLFSDPSRVRLCALLEDEELTVAELVSITELAQSRVSSHLARLKEAGVVRDRPSGSSTFYRMVPSLDEPSRSIWGSVRGALADPTLDEDRARRGRVLQARSKGSLDSLAGRMERHYSPGRTWEALARSMAALVEPGEILDVGCGDGTVSELLAPAARRIVGVDRSAPMVAAAQKRLAKFDHARVVEGDMHALPFDEASFDRVLVLHALEYSAEPRKAIAEAARVLRPKGRLLVSTLEEHAHRAITDRYGHVQPGLRVANLRRALTDAKLSVVSCGVTSREPKKPHFKIVTALAIKP